MKNTITAKQYFFTLNLTYYLQAFSILLFGLVVAFLISQRTVSPDNVGINSVGDWHYIVPIVLIVSLITAYFVFKLVVGRIKSDDPIRKKMPVYARAVLVRSILLELPGFIAAIAAYLTAQIYFLGAAFLIFILFLILKPTRNTIVQDLNLSAKEKELLEKDDAIIAEVERR
jgi:hypothetical protein